MSGTQLAGKDVGRGLLANARHVWSWMIATLAVIAGMGVAILVMHFGSDVNVNLLVSDPAAEGHLPGYTGMYTYANAFALLAGGVVCVFAAQLLRGRSGAFPSVGFLVTFGVLIAWLGLDDLFLFHEWAGLAIAEALGQTDDPGARSRLEGIVFAAYAIAWLAWIVRSWRTVRQTGFVLLGLVLVFFGLSVAIDLGVFLFPALVPDTAWMPTTIEVAEEMLKLAGTFFAFAYAWHTASRAIRREMDVARA